MNICLKLPVILLFAFATSMMVGTDAIGADYYEGKTIYLVYNTAPGGAVAITAQLIARHIGKHIPGRPTVVAQSVPGGALLKGIQYTKDATPDGLTLGWHVWSGTSNALNPPPLRISFESFEILGGFGTAWVTAARTSLAKDADQLLKVEKATFGSPNPRDSVPIRLAASLELLGIPYNFVGGYKGGAEMLAAFRRGEINLRFGTDANYITAVLPEMVKTGEAVPIFHWGRPTAGGATSPISTVSEVPTFDAYFAKAKGRKPTGVLWDMIQAVTTIEDVLFTLFMAPPKTPKDRADLVRAAFLDLLRDETFKSEARKALGVDAAFVRPEEAQSIVKQATTLSPAIMEAMNAMVRKMSR